MAVRDFLHVFSVLASGVVSVGGKQPHRERGGHQRQRHEQRHGDEQQLLAFLGRVRHGRGFVFGGHESVSFH